MTTHDRLRPAAAHGSVPSAPASGAMPIAIIGLGARFPGAPDLDAYARLLYEGRAAIAELPATRLHPRYFDPTKGTYAKSYSRLGGTIPVTPLADAARYGLTPEEAEDTDAIHRWGLEVARDAFVDAGLDPFDLVDRDVAVIIGNGGASDAEFDRSFLTDVRAAAAALEALPALADAPAEARARAAEALVAAAEARYGQRTPKTGASAQAALPGIIARAFGLDARHHVVNAACASTFAALDVAIKALRAGEVTTALSGGCSFSSWVSNVLFSQAQALSPDGSFPFSARSNGFISSDGCGLVLLERLDVALARGRRIRGVIRGIGGSCDGRAKGLWAPDKNGQVLAMTRAWADAGLAPGELGAVEAHGTSTVLGDATEVSALAEFFGPHLAARGRRVPVGSSKGNVGHSREAAGAAGLAKILLAFEREALAPSVGCHDPSPKIPWSEIPFDLAQGVVPWPRGEAPRVAAVDSFGIGGLNYHVVVEEAPTAERAAALVAAARPVTDDGAAAPIAIVGVGTVLPGARDADEAWRALVAGEAQTGAEPEGRLPSVGPGAAGHVVGFEPSWRRYRMPPALIARNDPAQFFALEAALGALDDAGLDLDDDARRGTSVMIGSLFGSDYISLLHQTLRVCEVEELARDVLAAAGLPGAAADALGEALRAPLPTVSEDSGGAISSSTLASRIAKTLDLHGPTYTVDAACASSLTALAAGCDALRAGAVDLVLAGGTDRNLRPRRQECLARVDALSAAGACAPFGPDADGVVLGEGAVVFALKRLADAEAAGDRVLAVVRGVGFASGGRLDGPAAADVDGLERAPCAGRSRRGRGRRHRPRRRGPRGRARRRRRRRARRRAPRLRRPRGRRDARRLGEGDVRLQPGRLGRDRDAPRRPRPRARRLAAAARAAGACGP
ncbi:MAG: polyketide synthase [Deltaproteobacteria bacterium]|nr:polyketide synthase [Deltaproteobacteria bacterium]